MEKQEDDKEKTDDDQGALLNAWRDRKANLPPATFGIESVTAPMPPGEAPAGQDGKPTTTDSARDEERTLRRKPIGGPFGAK